MTFAGTPVVHAVHDPAVDAADSEDRTDAQLRALVARGFQFIDPRDERGDVVAVVGVRAHHDVLDVVQLHGADEAVAFRVPGDDDIFQPSRVLWRRTGPACDVFDTLLALPDDRVPGALVVPRRASA